MLGINRYTPRYEPMSELVNDLFKGFLVRPVGYGTATATGTSAGADVPGRFVLDVHESDSAYTVQAEFMHRRESGTLAVTTPTATSMITMRFVVVFIDVPLSRGRALQCLWRRCR